MRRQQVTLGRSDPGREAGDKRARAALALLVRSHASFVGREVLRDPIVAPMFVGLVAGSAYVSRQGAKALLGVPQGLAAGTFFLAGAAACALAIRLLQRRIDDGWSVGALAPLFAMPAARTACLRAAAGAIMLAGLGPILFSGAVWPLAVEAGAVPWLVGCGCGGAAAARQRKSSKPIRRKGGVAVSPGSVDRIRKAPAWVLVGRTQLSHRWLGFPAFLRLLAVSAIGLAALEILMRAPDARGGAMLAFCILVCANSAIGLHVDAKLLRLLARAPVSYGRVGLLALGVQLSTLCLLHGAIAAFVFTDGARLLAGGVGIGIPVAYGYVAFANHLRFRPALSATASQIELLLASIVAAVAGPFVVVWISWRAYALCRSARVKRWLAP